MWMNGGGDSSWLTIRLIGGMATGDTGSNADGIGARVFVEYSSAGGTKTQQVQELSGSTTFLSMNSLELTFGLGDAVNVDSIKIEWPSGVDQVVENVAVNQRIEITEGQPFK